MTDFVLAGQNRRKQAEMTGLLAPLGINILLPADAGIAQSPDETGITFAENALIKADFFAGLTGLPAIADDSGLCVDALGGRPGVFSARYGGEGLTDGQRVELLLRELRGVPPRRRTARFVCAIACRLADGGLITAEGVCEGVITEAPEGENGFGYDPVFVCSGMKKSFASLSGEEKNALSHRGRAMALLIRKLKDYFKID